MLNKYFRYKIPSRTHFTEKVLVNMYADAKRDMKLVIKGALSLSLTTDSWTSITNDSYIAVTMHALTKDWSFKSYILTADSAHCSSHTAENLRDMLEQVLKDWDLTGEMFITTDNAANICKAITGEGSNPNLKHIRCFAHTINLAVQNGLKVAGVSKMLASVKRIVAHINRSPTANATFKEKQSQLGLPTHKLINDVSTRWGSTLQMLERFLEQKSALHATLESGKSADLLRAINTVDSIVMQHVVEVLQPFQSATTVMSSETLCTISLILPLLHSLISKCDTNASDPKIIVDMKEAMQADLRSRYNGANQVLMLQESSFLDPRFKTVSNLDKEEVDSLYSHLVGRVIELDNAAQLEMDTSEESLSSLDASGAV